MIPQPAALNTKPIDSDQGMKRAIALSVAFHLIAIAAFTLRAVFYPSDMIDLQDSIRVDMVALPDKQAQLPAEPVVEPAPAPTAAPAVEPPPPAPEPPKEAAKPKPELPKPAPEKPKIDLNKNKVDQAAALKRLEALQKIQKMVKDAPTSKPAPPQPVRGNVVTSGDALRGLARMEHQSYLGTIKASVKSQWNLPGWMASANLSARVRLYVDSNGNVVKKLITKSSGNQEYDARALGAVEAASPLPAPPSSLTGVLAVDGIEVELVPD